MSEKLKIVFAGTPEFSVPTLVALNNNNIDVSLVLTQPDRPSGRGMKESFSPVKKIAISLSIPIHQPSTLKDDNTYEILKACQADILIVVAYGLIIPERILSLFPKGCYNVHASLLPRWRGAAPIHRAIESGDKKIGVTIMRVVKKLDAGPMIIKECIDLNIDITTGEATERLAKIGAKLMIQTILLVERGNVITSDEQEDGDATYAEKINKIEAKLDMTQTPDVVIRKIHAFNPYPGISTTFHNKTLKLWRAVNFESLGIVEKMKIGKLYNYKGNLVIRLHTGVIKIIELQPEGKKKMDADSFLRGYEVDGIEKIH